MNALEGKKLPVYGDGKQKRDWLYVDDHVRALLEVATRGMIGQTYNIGGNNVIQNIEVVKIICDVLDELVVKSNTKIQKYAQLIEFIEDRPGHDVRYAINTQKIFKDLKWAPKESFRTGIRKTIKWYIDNTDWCKAVEERRISKPNMRVKIL